MNTGAWQRSGSSCAGSCTSISGGPAQLLQPLVFFLIVTTLFPLGLDLQLSLLRTMAPGVLWVAALLASLLSLDALFRSDAEDGTWNNWP